MRRRPKAFQASLNWSSRWRMRGRATVETTRKASSAGAAPPPDPDPDGATGSELAGVVNETLVGLIMLDVVIGVADGEDERGSESRLSVVAVAASVIAIHGATASAICATAAVDDRGLDCFYKHGPRQDVPGGVEPASVVAPKVEHGNVGKRGGRGWHKEMETRPVGKIGNRPPFPRYAPPRSARTYRDSPNAAAAWHGSWHMQRDAVLRPTADASSAQDASEECEIRRVTT
jgi:hypothetical protein